MRGSRSTDPFCLLRSVVINTEVWVLLTSWKTDGRGNAGRGGERERDGGGG